VLVAKTVVLHFDHSVSTTDHILLVSVIILKVLFKCLAASTSVECTWLIKSNVVFRKIIDYIRVFFQLKYSIKCKRCLHTICGPFYDLNIRLTSNARDKQSRPSVRPLFVTCSWTLDHIVWSYRTLSSRVAVTPLFLYRKWWGNFRAVYRDAYNADHANPLSVYRIVNRAIVTISPCWSHSSSIV